MVEKPQLDPWLLASRWETKAMSGVRGRVQTLAGKPPSNLTLCSATALSLLLPPPFQANTTLMDQMGQQVHATPTIPRSPWSLLPSHPKSHHWKDSVSQTNCI